MANIYDIQTGYAIAEGLQGSSVCDHAFFVAKVEAKARNRRVWLEDDDGVWLVGPKRTIRATRKFAYSIGFSMPGDEYD